MLSSHHKTTIKFINSAITDAKSFINFKQTCKANYQIAQELINGQDRESKRIKKMLANYLQERKANLNKLIRKEELTKEKKIFNLLILFHPKLVPMMNWHSFNHYCYGFHYIRMRLYIFLISYLLDKLTTVKNNTYNFLKSNFGFFRSQPYAIKPSDVIKTKLIAIENYQHKLNS